MKTLSVVRRKPILVLPLACRIPSARVNGPGQQLSIPTEDDTFGVLQVWVEVHQPGSGPLSDFTGNARFRANNAPNRARRDLQERAVGSRFDYLDLYVLSNCSVRRAEMITRCVECATNDYTNCHPLIEQGLVTPVLIPFLFLSANKTQSISFNSSVRNFICIKVPAYKQLTHIIYLKKNDNFHNNVRTSISFF